MQRKSSFFIVFIFLVRFQLIAQIKSETEFDKIIDQIFPLTEVSDQVNELYDLLLNYYTGPINLNHAQKEDLAAMQILSDTQIHNFYDYLSGHGKLISLYELQSIPGFDLSTIKKLIPFVKVTNNSKSSLPLVKRIFKENQSYLLLRYKQALEEKSGFSAINPSGKSNNRYLGSPMKISSRFRASHPKDYSINLLLEKDAGEQITWDNTTYRFGADFLSFHFSLFERGKLKNLTVGDYKIQIGQGLILNAGFGIKKGAETISSLKKYSLGILPYTSSIESGFFRGLASSFTFNNFKITTFYSFQPLDASIYTKTDVTSSKSFVSSIKRSGLHRTVTEIQDKGILKEHVAGFNIDFENNKPSFTIGSTFLYTHFDHEILEKPLTYNQFDFQGKSNLNFGLHFDYYWQNISVFGEAGLSKSGGKGYVAGAIFNLSKNMETSFLYRKYERDFHNFYGASFSENSTNRNEEGFYWGLKIFFARQFYSTAYFDVFKFPWLKFNVNRPTMGYEYMVRLNYEISKNSIVYFQFKEESKAKNVSQSDQNIHQVHSGIKRNYLANLNYKVNPAIDFKIRLQFSNYLRAGVITKGSAFINDVNIIIKKFRLGVRFALFDTEDNTNRLYAYEKDLLYAFSIPALSGRGIRNYFLIKYKINKKTDVWFKYARTRYYDRKEVGSGLEKINKPVKSDIKFQVRHKF